MFSLRFSNFIMDKSTLTLALLLTLYTVLAFGKQFYEMQEYETQDKMKQNEKVEEPVEFKQEIKDGVAETLAGISACLRLYMYLTKLRVHLD